MVLKRPPPRGRPDRYVVPLKVLVHAFALWPLLQLLRGALVDLRGDDPLVALGLAAVSLGADPVQAITHATGDWALRFLLASLAMTPLRRLAGWPWPLRFRRLLGLYAFFYACLHLATWLALDLGGYWAQALQDVVERPFVTAGFAAWLALLPLAITSTRGWMRRLGRRWGQLHRLAYAAGVLAVLHFLWLVKSDLREPLVYAGVLALLLAVRVVHRWRQARRGPAQLPEGA